MMNGYERLSPIGYGKSRLSSAYRLERGGSPRKGERGGIRISHTHLARERVQGAAMSPMSSNSPYSQQGFHYSGTKFPFWKQNDPEIFFRKAEFRENFRMKWKPEFFRFTLCNLNFFWFKEWKTETFGILECS